MNVNSNINKLLYALRQRDKLYKINSFKFYNEKQQKYSTKYQVLKKTLEEVWNIEEDKIELVERYKQDIECYGKIELLKYLVKEYEGSEANGL